MATKKSSNTINLENREIRVAGRYKLSKKIGSGAFGDIYVGTAEMLLTMISYCSFVAEDILSSKLVAVKIEHKSSAHPQLEYEAKVYKYLAGIRTQKPLYLLLIIFYLSSWCS